MLTTQVILGLALLVIGVAVNNPVTVTLGASLLIIARIDGTRKDTP